MRAQRVRKEITAPCEGVGCLGSGAPCRSRWAAAAGQHVATTGQVGMAINNLALTVSETEVHAKAAVLSG